MFPFGIIFAIDEKLIINTRGIEKLSCLRLGDNCRNTCWLCDLQSLLNLFKHNSSHNLISLNYAEKT